MSFSSLLSQINPISSLAGGALIGCAAASLLLFNGNILGASGIVSSTSLTPAKALSDPAQHWKLVFLSSFLLTARFFYAPSFDATTDNGFLQPLSSTGYMVAGLLVGFGTQLGNGCTSGHGICGLARFSKRSLVAVMTFMVVAGATVAGMKSQSLASWTNLLRTTGEQMSSSSSSKMETAATALSLLVLAGAVFSRWFHPVSEKKSSSSSVNDIAKAGPAALSGMLFAHGLAKSGMVQSSKVVGFFDLTGSWDPSLAFVMMGGLAVSGLAYQLVFRGTVARPLALTPASRSSADNTSCTDADSCKFQIPSGTMIDRNLVAGAVCFGAGWGIAGICPGPGLFLAATGVPAVLQWWLPSFLVGSAMGKALK